MLCFGIGQISGKTLNREIIPISMCFLHTLKALIRKVRKKFTKIAEINAHEIRNNNPFAKINFGKRMKLPIRKNRFWKNAL